MGLYYSVRIWQLKAGQAGADLEQLAATGYTEMQRWIPGVQQVSLLRAAGNRQDRYVLTTTLSSYEAYRYWRQFEEEASDYWERYASIAIQWEQLCYLVDEYGGEVVLDTRIDAL